VHTPVQIIFLQGRLFGCEVEAAEERLLLLVLVFFMIA
jgi:hypothetical protein